MRLLPITAVLGGILKNKLVGAMPLVLAHEVTEACNLRCTFCSSSWRDRTKEEELDFGAIKGLIRQAKGLGVAWYVVTGGEPLLRSEIPEIVHHASRERMITSLITNGVLLTERLADIAPHLDFLIISIDTLNRSKYKHLRGSDCLSTVLASVDKIKAEFPQLKTSINAVLMAETLDEVGDLVHFAADNGIGITFEPVVPQDIEAGPIWGSAEEFDRALTELLRLRKEYPKVIWNTEYYLRGVLERRRYVCHSETLIRVNSAGNVIAPCYDHRDLAIIGNVRERSLKELLKSERAMEQHVKAHTCERRDCYLMCYAEPSMVIESNLCAVKGMCGLLSKFW